MTKNSMKKRFRGFLPVVMDLETAGFNAKTDALLEVAAVFVSMDEYGLLQREETLSYHVEPFPDANFDAKSLEFNGIDPYHPFRFAKSEKEILNDLYAAVNKQLKKQGCNRAVMVAHNATFDQSFLHAATARTGIETTPFHRFTTFDTATLCAVAFGQTVLAKAMEKANLEFDTKQAHSAIYDAEKTADLFCYIVNSFGSQL